MTIDGYSQPGASENTLALGNDAVLLIELNGTNAGALSNGLALNVNGCGVRGLVINRFGGDGILLASATNIIEGNFIGTDPTGSLDLGNGGSGITALVEGNVIGGLTPAARNIISGNDENGIAIELFGILQVVVGNYIGTDHTGTAALGNTLDGISVGAIVK